MALAIMMYGGCARRSDVVLLGRQHLTKDGRLRYTQFKNRYIKPIEVDIPLIPEFQNILDASPLGDMTFLVTEFNRPFSANGFGNRMRKWCDDAGLPQCSAHGVRKPAAARLAELGCTDHEIMAIGGWKTLKQVQLYTKGARRRVMADHGMDKLTADIDGTKVSNLSGGGGWVRQ